MICGFCGSRNGEGEHRCRRCGRRPGDVTGETVLHRTNGPLAMQPAPCAVDAPPRPAGRPYQASLFQPASNVIPFEAYAPVEPRPRPRSAPPAPRPKPARKAPRVPEEQGTLDFLAPAPPKPRTLATTVEAVVVCGAPVAVKLHRAVAAAIDWILVILAYGFFLGVFRLLGGPIVLNRVNLGMFGGALLLLALVYGLTWALAGTETPGMRWTGLKLLTFDGFPPERRQRLLRLVGSILGLTTGIGLAWPLVDEEGLGWQDHISRTFPTPSQADNLVLVQG